MCTQLFQFLNLPFCWSVFWWHFTPSCGAWAFGLLQVIFPGFFLFSFVLIFTTMAYRNSRWNSRVKKSFLPFLCWRSFYFAKCIFRASWSFCRPGVCICNTSLLRFEFFSFTIRHKSDESQCKQLITSSVLFNEPQRTRPSVITTYANIPRWYRFFLFFIWFISFILDQKRSIALSFGQTSSPSPPARYLKTLHTDNLY